MRKLIKNVLQIFILPLILFSKFIVWTIETLFDKFFNFMSETVEDTNTICKKIENRIWNWQYEREQKSEKLKNLNKK